MKEHTLLNEVSYAKGYVKTEAPEELRTRRSKPLRLQEIRGKIKKGSNEATKAIERGIAALVVIVPTLSPKRS